MKQFSLGYFFKGAGIEDWFKAWGAGFRLIVTIALIAFLVTGIRSCFRPQGNVSNPKVTVLPFGHFEGNVTQSPSQKTEQKRPWWQPIPYVSVAGETRWEDGGTKSGFKAEVGLRLDF